MYLHLHRSAFETNKSTSINIIMNREVFVVKYFLREIDTSCFNINTVLNIDRKKCVLKNKNIILYKYNIVVRLSICGYFLTVNVQTNISRYIKFEFKLI